MGLILFTIVGFEKPFEDVELELEDVDLEMVVAAEASSVSLLLPLMTGVVSSLDFEGVVGVEGVEGVEEVEESIHLATQSPVHLAKNFPFPQ